MTSEMVTGVTGPPENRSLYGVADPRQFRRGGVGVVYEATLLAERHGFPAGTRVGLKLLTGVDADRFAKLSARSALLREHPHARLARHIESFVGPPLAMEELDEEDCNLFFSVHEWVDGQPLTEHIPDASPAEILDWMSDVAEAVDHLHGLPEGGFAHRDIHARNIIIEPDRRARLIDFDTILWGEATDTVLTSLHALPRLDDLSGTPAAQAHDRSMLALVVLRALGRDATATSSMNDLSRRSLESLRASTADSPEVVASLMRAVRQPPEHAADVVANAQFRLKGPPRRTLRLASVVMPWRRGDHAFDADKEYARLDALVSGHSNKRARARIAVAGLTTALLVAGAIAAVTLPDDPTRGDTDSSVDEPSTDRVELMALEASALDSAGGTCAIRTQGTVWCWGEFSTGEAATQTDKRVPEVLPGPVDVSSLSVGEGHTCAVVEGGFKCWGEDTFGQLGDGLPRQGRGEPDLWTALQGVTKIAAGGSSTCAIAEQGRVYCWGLEFGAPSSGAGRTSWSAKPELVPGTIGVSDISVGNGIACYVKEGLVYCWGEASARLGQVPRTFEPYQALGAPTLVASVKNAVSVVVGPSTTCAVTEFGRLYCWGRALWVTDSEDIWDWAPDRVSGLGHVKAVGIGSEHLCALTVRGKVLCVGRNENGELGDGTTVTPTRPVRALELSHVRALAVGNFHTCALRKDHTVWCWGTDYAGQAGDGGSRLPQLTPKQVLTTATTLPAKPWVVEPGGYGPLRVGMTTAEAFPTGLITQEDNEDQRSCGITWHASAALEAQGAYVEFRAFERDDLDSIWVGRDANGRESPIATAKGIHVGSTITQLKAAYGSQLEYGMFDGEGGEYGAYVLFGEHGALMFATEAGGPDDTIFHMQAVPGTNMANIEPDFGGC